MRYYWELTITELGKINQQVRFALRSGQLKQKACQVENCNVAIGNTIAHHEDYDKPLDITWLCKSHHRQRHVEINKIRPKGYILNPKPKPVIPQIKDVIKPWPDDYRDQPKRRYGVWTY